MYQSSRFLLFVASVVALAYLSSSNGKHIYICLLGMQLLNYIAAKTHRCNIAWRVLRASDEVERREEGRETQESVSQAHPSMVNHRLISPLVSMQFMHAGRPV